MIILECFSILDYDAVLPFLLLLLLLVLASIVELKYKFPGKSLFPFKRFVASEVQIRWPCFLAPRHLGKRLQIALSMLSFFDH